MVKLIRGDCLAEMAKLAPGSVDMVLCDLPYGTTRNAWDTVIPLPELWAEYERIAKPSAAIVLFAQSPFDKMLGASNLKALRYEWIWRKNVPTGFLNANRSPLKDHENVLVFYRKSPVYNAQKKAAQRPYTVNARQGAGNYGRFGVRPNVGDVITDRHPRTVLDFKSDRGLHPTQKPVALCEYLIRTYTNEGDTVLDNTMGSGTTGVAPLEGTT
jgi:site-specific DNA-methyltransferase (adenine-specific)